jgi:hypothetical protein
MFETNYILYGKLPRSWTQEEANQVKEHFRSQRPEIPVILAKRLWKYWQFTCGDQPLFEADEDNVALLLHAQAYGEDVPAAGDGSQLGELLKKHRRLYEEPPFPPCLTWGPRAILSQEVLAGLDSPVLHVWSSSINEGMPPQQILVIGNGLPEIRQQVFSNTFVTALRVHAVANDMMDIGVLRVEMPNYPETPPDIPFKPVGDGRITLAPDVVQSAAEAMQDLYNFLTDLAQKTGLVQIHDILVADQKKLTDAYKAYAKAASSNPDRVILFKYEDENEAEDLVTLSRYWQIGDDVSVLLLPLSADLLQTDDYKQLLEAYEAATFYRSKMDIRIRRDYHKREADRLVEEKLKFEEASDEERKIFWHTTVLLVEEFEFTLGITIKLAQPKEMDAELYYKHNAPILIEKHRYWEQRMENILRSLEMVEKRTDSPIHRFAVSRFFDAAMRGRVPDESQAAAAAFEAWRARLQPLLWFEWRQFLKRKNIPPGSISTPHTAFHTWLTPRSEEEIAKVELSPFTLVDLHRSVGVFDAENHVMIVRDATDYTKPFPSSQEAGQQRWERLLALADKPDMTDEMFAKALREELRQAPGELLQPILAELFESHKIKMAYSVVEEAELEAQRAQEAHKETLHRIMLDNLARAIYKTAVARRIYRALLAIRVMAYQTARETLPTERDFGQWTVLICLVRAIVECSISGYPFQELLPDVFHRRTSIAPPSIRSALDHAENADRDYVESWIENLQAHPDDLDKAIGQLLRGLPEGEKVCNPEEYAALLAQSAIEAARLARELEAATTLLSDDHEVIANAFAKLGQALEEALLADFSSSSQGDLVDLVEVLTGERLPEP